MAITSPPGDRDPEGTDRGAVDPATRTKRTANRIWYVGLLAPYVGLLWLPFYAKKDPQLFGFPFFYWYQFLWILISAVLTAVIYVLTTTSDEPDAGGARVGGRR